MGTKARGPQLSPTHLMSSAGGESAVAVLARSGRISVVADEEECMADRFGLSYLHTHLAFAVGADVDVEPDVAFFDSHFARGPVEPVEPVERVDEEPPTATIAVRRTEPRPAPDDAEPVLIRRSRTEFFTVRARQVGGPERPGLVCDASGTWLAFTPGRHHVRLDVPGHRPGRELIELVRNTVLGNEENHGVVIVHAAVVDLGRRAVVIVGRKGAGKTSSALEMILHHGGRMLSGDKALLLPAGASGVVGAGAGGDAGGDGPGAGAVRVAGWPDWPHVGLGTVSRFQQLVEGFDLGPLVGEARAGGDLWSMRHKVPLDPAGYAEVVDFCPPGTILPVAAVVYPCLGPRTPEGLTPCRHEPHRLAPHVESSFDSGTAGWNPLVAPSPRLAAYRDDAIRRLAACPAFELSGTGALHPADLDRLAAAIS